MQASSMVIAGLSLSLVGVGVQLYRTHTAATKLIKAQRELINRQQVLSSTAYDRSIAAQEHSKQSLATSRKALALLERYRSKYGELDIDAPQPAPRDSGQITDERLEELRTASTDQRIGKLATSLRDVVRGGAKPAPVIKVHPTTMRLLKMLQSAAGDYDA